MLKIDKEVKLIIEINGEHLQALRDIVEFAKNAINKEKYMEGLKAKLVLIERLLYD